jgi:hypothetical protein
MSQQNGDLARRRKRIQGMFGVFILWMSVGVFLPAALNNPRVEALHVTDILKLTAAGAIIWCGLVSLVGFFLGGFALGPRAGRTETPAFASQ